MLNLGGGGSYSLARDSYFGGALAEQRRTLQPESHDDDIEVGSLPLGFYFGETAAQEQRMLERAWTGKWEEESTLEGDSYFGGAAAQ